MRIRRLTRAVVTTAAVVVVASGAAVVAAPTASAENCFAYFVCGGAENGTDRTMLITTELDNWDETDLCYVWNYDGDNHNPVRCRQEALYRGAREGGNGTGVDIDAFTFSDEGYYERLPHGSWQWRQKGVWTKIAGYQFVDCGVGNGHEIRCDVHEQADVQDGCMVFALEGCPGEDRTLGRRL